MNMGMRKQLNIDFGGKGEVLSPYILLYFNFCMLTYQKATAGDRGGRPRGSTPAVDLVGGGREFCNG